MNKTELLSEMFRMGACQGAKDYVQAHASNDAQTIWSTCTRLDWLFWYAFRKAPGFAQRFAFKAANRAKGRAIQALEASGLSDQAAALKASPKIVDQETARQVQRYAAGYAAAGYAAAADAAAAAAGYAAGYAADATAAAATGYAAAAGYAAGYAAAADAAAAAAAAGYAAERQLQLARMQRWQVR